MKRSGGGGRAKDSGKTEERKEEKLMEERGSSEGVWMEERGREGIRRKEMTNRRTQRRTEGGREAGERASLETPVGIEHCGMSERERRRE